MDGDDQGADSEKGEMEGHVPEGEFKALDYDVDMVVAAPSMTENARRTMWRIVIGLCLMGILGIGGLLLVWFREGLADEGAREKVETVLLPLGEANAAVKELPEYAEAIEAMERGEYGRALARIEAMELQVDGSSVVPLLAARSYEAQGERQRAMESVGVAIERDPGDIEALCLQGALLDGTGDLPAAVQAYEKALSIEPDHVEAWYSLATAYRRTGRGQDAVGAYERTLKLSPGHVQARDDLARMFEGIGLFDEALRILKDGFDLNPNNAEVNLRLSMYYCRRGDLPNGGSYGLRAVQLAPESGRCKSWLASVLELQGNDEGALLMAEEAAVLAPEDTGIMLQVGYFASKLERPAKSTVWLMRVLDRWPDNEVALSLLGKNYMGQSNYLLAREHFEKTVALKPDDVNAWQGLAKACRKLGDEEAAEAAMERVKALGGGGKKDA